MNTMKCYAAVTINELIGEWITNMRRVAKVHYKEMKCKIRQWWNIIFLENLTKHNNERRNRKHNESYSTNTIYLNRAHRILYTYFIMLHMFKEIPQSL